MRRLILADIHGSLPALEAVLADAGAVDEILCLGDTVGYGPHPSECLECLCQAGALAVLGNHDAEMLHMPQLPPPAQRDGHQVWLQWTYEQLSAVQLGYLASLPEQLEIVVGDQRVTVVHGAPRGVILHPDMPDRLFAEAFAEVPGTSLLFGHYHCRIERSIAGRRYVGVKSVGQARQHDPVAGYAIQCDGRIVHHTVPYDVERVVRDLDRIGLPDAFLTRWLHYLRTGYDAEWSRPYRPD